MLLHSSVAGIGLGYNLADFLKYMLRILRADCHNKKQHIAIIVKDVYYIYICMYVYIYVRMHFSPSFADFYNQLAIIGNCKPNRFHYYTNYSIIPDLLTGNIMFIWLYCYIYIFYIYLYIKFIYSLFCQSFSK